MNLLKEAFIEGYKQRAEGSDLIFDNASRMYAISLFDKYQAEQLTLTDVVHTLKDCLIAQKPVEYNGKKYYVSKLDIMQNGDEFCDLIDIETYDCIDDIKSTEVKIF